MTCGKRGYPSERDARDAHRHASFRFRVYWCEQCQAWHVTAAEKRLGRDGDDWTDERPTR